MKRHKHNKPIKKTINLKRQSIMKTQHGATLNGLVNAHNADTQASFEYGLDTTYGGVISVDELVTGNEDKPVQANVEDMEAETLYHFRLAMENSVGTAYGEDKTFITLKDGVEEPGLPTGTTEDATNVH